MEEISLSDHESDEGQSGGERDGGSAKGAGGGRTKKGGARLKRWSWPQGRAQSVRKTQQGDKTLVSVAASGRVG